MKTKAAILAVMMTLTSINYALACYCTTSCRTYTVGIDFVVVVTTEVTACLHCNPAKCWVTFK